MHLDGIRNCKKKKKTKHFWLQNRGLQLNQEKNTSNISNCIKIKRSSQTKFYMQLDSIRNCKKKKKKNIFCCKK